MKPTGLLPRDVEYPQTSKQTANKGVPCKGAPLCPEKDRVCLYVYVYVSSVTMSTTGSNKPVWSPQLDTQQWSLSAIWL